MNIRPSSITGYSCILEPSASYFYFQCSIPRTPVLSLLVFFRFRCSLKFRSIQRFPYLLSFSLFAPPTLARSVKKFFGDFPNSCILPISEIRSLKKIPRYFLFTQHRLYLFCIAHFTGPEESAMSHFAPSFLFFADCFYFPCFWAQNSGGRQCPFSFSFISTGVLFLLAPIYFALWSQL